MEGFVDFLGEVARSITMVAIMIIAVTGMVCIIEWAVGIWTKVLGL